jgi:hypothetical protein
VRRKRPINRAMVEGVPSFGQCGGTLAASFRSHSRPLPRTGVAAFRVQARVLGQDEGWSGPSRVLGWKCDEMSRDVVIFLEDTADPSGLQRVDADGTSAHSTVVVRLQQAGRCGTWGYSANA